MKLKPPWARSWLTMHFGGIQTCLGRYKEDKGWLWKRREETSLSFLKIFHDVKKNTEFSSQHYFFLEDIYCKENKLFSRNIFSSPQYFPSNVSS